MQVRSERGVLPEDHPERVATRLGLAINALEREDSAAATSILEAYMDDEEDRITKVCLDQPLVSSCMSGCVLHAQAVIFYVPGMEHSWRVAWHLVIKERTASKLVLDTWQMCLDGMKTCFLRIQTSRSPYRLAACACR